MAGMARPTNMPGDRDVDVMKISIPYNDSRTVTFEIPEKNLSEILRPNRVEVPEDPQKLIEQVLQNPIGSEKIEQIVKQKEISCKTGKTGKKQVCIICDDITRKTPVHLIIPAWSTMKHPRRPGMSGLKIHRANLHAMISLRATVECRHRQKRLCREHSCLPFRKTPCGSLGLCYSFLFVGLS